MSKQQSSTPIYTVQFLSDLADQMETTLREYLAASNAPEELGKFIGTLNYLGVLIENHSRPEHLGDYNRLLAEFIPEVGYSLAQLGALTARLANQDKASSTHISFAMYKQITNRDGHSSLC